jgi:hypothetical protein
MLLDNPTYKVLLVVLSTWLFTGCSKNQHDELDDFLNDGRAASQEYQVYPNKVEKNGIHVATKLQSDLAKGELVLHMKIKNDSDKDIVVDCINAGMNVDDQRVVIPEILKEFKTTISSGGEEDYQIYYHPINSIDLYNRSHYRGDMKQAYSLDLNFISDGNGNQLMDARLVFKLSDGAYHSYLSANAREKYMQIYNFDFKNEVFDSEEGKYLKKVLNDDSKSDFAIFSIDPAITINRMIFNINNYKENDTLIVDMRFLNEDSRSLKVIPAECLVKISGKTYRPLNHFSDSFESGRLPDSSYIFKPGTRLHLRLKYNVPAETETWELSRDWLLIKTGNDLILSWNKLLYKDIAFKKSTIMN